MKLAKYLCIIFLTSSIFAKEIVPTKKYATVYNNFSDKLLKKNNYIIPKRKPSSYEMSEEEMNKILESAGLSSYIKDMDALDKKIFIHRLNHYFPRKLIEFYPEIPAEILRAALKKI